MTRSSLSRRHFIKLGLAGAAAAQLGPRALAGEGAELAEDDPMAMALGYHADGSNVDSAKYPNFVAGQTCRNCLHFKGGDEDSLALCALFPGKQVRADGWCKVWAKG